MKIKGFSKALAGFLSACMLLSSFTIAASAATDFKSETHDVFSRTTSTIAPGVSQDICYAYNKEGKQIVYYVATADISRDDVLVQSSYKDAQCTDFGMDKLTNQMASATQKYSDPNNSEYISEYYTAVAGVNGDFYNMTTGQPSGAFVMNGVMSSKKANNRPWFAIFADGTALCGANNTDWDAAVAAHGEAKQAVGGSAVLVKDGIDLSPSITGSYLTDRHSRTMVGVTAEGKVVMTVLDGRQEPFSAGGNAHELAQIMLEAGCVSAINLDGGGSTTFAARQEGADSVTVVNRPSDGSERSISSGLIIASTAAPSNVFDHAVLKAENEYVTPNSTVKVSASGVSPAGTSADIPEDISWQLADASFGTVSDGEFVSNGKTGDAVVQMVYSGNVVGETVIHVVLPTALSFNQSEITVPYGKSVELEMTATYGLNEVVIKSSDIEFTLAESGIGSIDGFTFTAGDGTVAKSAVTAKVIGTDVTADATITLGKGSEVLFDFEDGDVSDFDLGYVPYNYVLPEGKVYAVTPETGKVHSGNGAMALDINYGNSTESGYMMTALEFKGEEKNYENATKLGMWMYISDEDVSTWIRYTVYPLELNSDGEYVRASDSITDTKCDNVASTTGFVNKFEEPGWHYISIDLTKYKGLSLHDGYILQFYISDRDGKAYDYYYNQHKSYNGRYVFYVDDITVDYSSAVDDREAPVFSGAYYATTTMSDAVDLNNQTVDNNELSFSAKVADDTTKSNYTGLDESTAKSYVDGVEVPCTIKNGTISNSDIVLADGIHHIKFSVCDKAGNYSSIIRDINVQANSGKPTVKLVAHDPSLDKIKLGSLWYADVVATDIEKVKLVEVDIDLNNMSKWELDHMEVAKGFEASYSIQDDENIATITINRVGNNDATGEAVLVSMPIRTWELKMGYTYTSGTKKGSTAYTYAQFKAMKEFWPVDISMEVDRGIVTFVDGTTDTFSGEAPQVDTESYKMAKDMISTTEGKAYYDSWNGGHIHTAESVEDKAATCTESGYTGRTFCEVCNSVVEWGTTVPATGHTYELIDDVMKCKTCGDLFNGEKDGKMYADGVLANGWIDDSYYTDGEKLTGIKEVEGYYYDFGDDGISKGKYTGPLTDEIGLRYSANGKCVVGWWEFGEKGNEDIYYFGKRVNGYYYAVTGKINLGSPLITYTFDSDYHLVSGDWYKTENGTRYYWAGKIAKKFLTVEGKTYYFDNTTGYLQYGIQSIALTHGDKPTYYYFDFTTGELIDTFSGDGLRVYDDLVVYLSDGEPIAAGLVQDDEGNYYFINSTRKAVRNCDYAFNEKNSNGLLPAGKYSFGPDGKMIYKQGIVMDSDGEIRYYVDNVAVAAGLVQDKDGSYYYINGTKKAVKDCDYAFNEKNSNGLLPAGKYSFGPDGKMIYKQGIVMDSDGEIRYYVDNVAVAAGLVQDNDGNYYYINSTKKAVKDCEYAFSAKNSNGLLPAGKYSFGPDGKMIYKQGVVKDADGEIRYYVDNVAVAAGLVQDKDGNYYYINSTKKAVKNCKYAFNEERSNGLLPAGVYTFDAEGKLILD